MELVLFGDQQADYQLFLRYIFHLKGNPILTSLLERVSAALREEVSQQTHRYHHKRIARFSTVRELVERHYASGQPNPAIESATVCLAQLSHYICYHAERPDSYLRPAASDLPSPHLLGACTGLIAASAIASAASLTALLPLAVEAVRIAFRIGSYVGDVAERLGGPHEMLESWSTIVAVSDKREAETALDEYNQRNGVAISNRMWISAYSPNAITLSGPPSKRRRLLKDSKFFSKAQHLDIGVHGPYHASHIHSTADVEQIISADTREVFSQSKIQFPVHSSVTAKPIDGLTPIELLHEVIVETLTKPLRWDRVSKECASGSLAPIDGKCKIHAIGPSDLTESLVATIKSAGDVQVSTETLNRWLSDHSSNPAGTGKSIGSDIAIVGMAGRFPDAADLEKFWELLEKGLDVHREVPKDRYNVKTHTDPTSKKKNTSHTPYGNFIESPGLFDARFFNMSPREASQTDPMQRLELATAYEAMEMAGIVPGRSASTKHDRIGTFYGMTSDDWREINAAQDIDTYFISGGVRAFGSGRINYFFKFSGPSFIVDTACSSSFAAIQLACTSLRAGDCDTAFTGGANVLTNPDIFSGLSRGHFLSRTGNCKTFDNDADGYCRGDGVATVILKRMEDALSDKDPILGVIRASATNHSAEAVSITHPHVGSQQFLFDKVLRESNTNAHDVNYVEMHGTGTQAGDAVEMESVSSIFAPSHPRRSPEQPLYLGSVKSNIGHGEAVSGVCALIKVLLMMQRSMIPPHCGIKGTMNKNFPQDLKERGVNIAFEKTPFPQPPGGKRIIFVNNFSAAGGNTALLLEDAPEKNPLEVQDPRSFHVVTVSAKSLASFKKNIERLEAYVDKNSSLDLASLAYTGTARRPHHNYRAAFPVSDIQQVKAALAKAKDETHSPISPEPPRVAFAFTGQGSQYPEMGRQLFETSKRFRSELEYFNRLAECQGFPSFLALTDGSVEDIKTLSPVITQLGMVCVQMALVHLWKFWGLEPTVVIGHSLGEYAALYAADVLSAADTIFLVGTRAQQLENECTSDTHAMLAVKGDTSAVRKAVNGRDVEIACINADAETVLSGTVSKVHSISEKLRSDGIESKKLNVPFAFHSSQVHPILTSFQTAGSAVTFHAPKVPVISPLLGEVIRDDGVFNAGYLARHCRETVNFRGGLAAAIDDGTIDSKALWIDIGAHPVCAGMIKTSIDPPVVTPSLRRGEDPWKTIATSMCALYLAGANINWSAYHRDYESFVDCIPLPIYSFDEKVYWLQYVNEWTLRKGDPAPALSPIEAPSKLSTTSIHRITREDVDKKKATVVAESDLADPLLHKTVAGHSVNGTGLGPSSLYGDMALTLTNYAYKLLRPDDEHLDMNVRDMENPAPLLVKNLSEPQHQVIQVETALDLDRRKAAVTVSSLAANGKTRTIHAKCTVALEDSSEWASEWDRNAFLVQTRVDLLEKKVKDGEAHRLLRGMVYKLFASLVDYSDKYQGMKEVVLDTPNLEASAQIDFQASAQDGNFYLPPYFIDSIGHLAGFIMNGNDGLDSKNQVFISHGWESMRLPTTLEAGKRYHTWVKMQPHPSGEKSFAGDVYVFDETKKTIGVIGGLKFQCIPRQLLNTFIPPAKGTSPQAAAPPKTEQKTSPKPKAPSKPAEKKQVKAQGSKKGPPASGNADKALHIVADEVGVDMTELADPIQFADIGVDSLMTLTISGRFREELDLDVESTLFTDCPTVGALKGFLSSQGGTEGGVEGSESNDDSSDDSEMAASTRATTPNRVSPGRKPVEVAGSNKNDIITIIRSTIAEQMNLDVEEITETTDLSTIGMDSLMSLNILGILGEKTGESFEPSLLADNTSIAALRKALGVGAEPPSKQAEEPPKASENTKEAPTRQVSATSVLLQGHPKTATKQLFLLPDGSGSPTSYSSIPPIAPKELCVYGLSCPFLKDPASFKCGVQGVTKMYIKEMFRRQPEGPYLIGGWSAGGVFAFEATRQLAAMKKANPNKNYEVEKLLLLDSPCPVALEPLPTRLHVFFNDIGLLGDGNPDNTPKWLLPHFQASIDALKAYDPVLLKDDPYDAPKTYLVWCTDGVAKNPEDPRPPPQDDDPKSMKWLLNNRTDFNSNGWEKLLGEENCSCTKISGNHFTMMRQPIASDLQRKMKEGLAL